DAVLRFHEEPPMHQRHTIVGRGTTLRRAKLFCRGKDDHGDVVAVKEQWRAADRPREFIFLVRLVRVAHVAQAVAYQEMAEIKDCRSSSGFGPGTLLMLDASSFER